MKAIAAIALITLFALSSTTRLPAVTIDTVLIGNAGNAADSTGFGAVNYNYRMGTYEVTVGQYTEFLNAVAKTDTYGLYDDQWMGSDANTMGIARTGPSGNRSYSVIGSPSQPVVAIDWGDAARFANWMHNGQPTGLQSASTTEGGAYTLNGATTSGALNAVSRNAGATWFIPSENEWYKAAYHKNDGVTGNYWEYATSSDSTPISTQPSGSPNSANFYADDGLANGFNDGYAVSGGPDPSEVIELTDVGSYWESVGPYGTFDQAGNVWEWNESLVNAGQFQFRGKRGGAWEYLAEHLAASHQDYDNPSVGHVFNGFRLATVTVPEPSTCALGAFALLGLVAFRRRQA